MSKGYDDGYGSPGIDGDRGQKRVSGNFELRDIEGGRRLEMARKKLSNASCRDIKDLCTQEPDIIELDISENNITDEGFRQLSSLTNLRYVDVSKNNLGAKTAVTVKTLMKNNAGLATLNLYGTGLDVNAVRDIAAALGSSSLQHLNLGDNQVGDDGCEAIAQQLLKTDLINLELAHNGIGDRGAKAMAQALMNNPKLRYLNLFTNKIKNEGAIAVADSFKENENLWELNIASQSYMQKGTDALKSVVTDMGKNYHIGIHYDHVESKSCVVQ